MASSRFSTGCEAQKTRSSAGDLRLVMRTERSIACKIRQGEDVDAAGGAARCRCGTGPGDAWEAMRWMPLRYEIPKV